MFGRAAQSFQNPNSEISLEGALSPPKFGIQKIAEKMAKLQGASFRDSRGAFAENALPNQQTMPSHADTPTRPYADTFP